MYVGAGYDTSHPYVYKVKYELEVFRDCAKGIQRTLANPAVDQSGKAASGEGDAPSAVPQETEQ
jgi:hypothetical protein